MVGLLSPFFTANAFAQALAAPLAPLAERLAGKTNSPALVSSNGIAGANARSTAATNTTGTIERFLDEHQARYQAALIRARTWLDALEVNPAELRAHGIKGKKKLAELLDVYLRLHTLASAAEKPALLKRIRAITAVTTKPEYHDMARISDQQFKEDSTSYLRVAFLMDRFGLDTRLYRQEIGKILPRLNDHMKYRGSDQRMAFHLYYQHFGLAEPFPLAAAFQAGIIAGRHDAAWFKQARMEIYNLTHEIFVPYEFGDKLDADFFSDADKAYLRELLADLTAYAIALDDADLTAELTSCLRYLHFTDLKVYSEALQYLLKSQWPDGKWGNYEQQRSHYGDYV
ncbi:MAG: hypothetical protein HYV36_01670, partial [Lentisphaerae bacterium]|nr:hypothetical protein [Lentisphaerota bacterium]